jgi:sensor histidine kinase YesM
MKKIWKEAIIHILFWVSTAWLISTSFSIQSHEIELNNGIETVNIVRNSGLAYQLLLCIMVSFFAFYINYWLLIKRNRPAKMKISGVIYVFAALLILIYFLVEFRFFLETLPIPKQIAFGVAIFYFSLSIAYSLFKKSLQDTAYLQKLIIDKKQAELNLLRNQLQPHFLFNALNNLLSMVKPGENPKLVSSIDKLSHLLRFVIEDNKAEKIPISKEIEFLKNYIDLQKLRFDEGEVCVQFTLKGSYNQQKVEPGLFIPFIENAFKYGTEPEKPTTLEIEFDLSKPDVVQFTSKNKIMMANTNGIGSGIEATRKRLGLIYPDKHELRISEVDEFIVHLTINTK